MDDPIIHLFQQNMIDAGFAKENDFAASPISIEEIISTFAPY